MYSDSYYEYEICKIHLFIQINTWRKPFKCVPSLSVVINKLKINIMENGKIIMEF